MDSVTHPRQQDEQNREVQAQQQVKHEERNANPDCREASENEERGERFEW